MYERRSSAGPASCQQPTARHTLGDDRNKLEAWGCRVSSGVADLSAHPFAQIALIAFCFAWFALRLPVEILTAALSILAITLTQMVLNQQKERSADAHRRDVALHAKLDELVHASRRARDDLMGAEELDEEEIARLKQAMRPDREAVRQDDSAAPRDRPADSG